MNATAAEDEDVVTASLAGRFLATLGHSGRRFRDGDAAPPGLHWCLAPEYGANADLEADGIARDGIIPTLDLPHRLWAGATIRFVSPLRIGESVVRRSRVVDVARKTGRSGPLAFATIEHRFLVAGETRIAEEQTIVYRGADPGRDDRSASPADPAGPVLRRLPTDAAMLFRFSALTFNAHRIHYDRDHARSEGLPERLVHGTLTAALLLDSALPAAGSTTVTIQARRPVPCGAEIVLAQDPADQARAVALVDGAVAMSMVVATRA